MATLLENWRNLAYGNGLDDKQREQLWTGYFTIEKGIYEQILSNPAEVVSGTVKELADTVSEGMAVQLELKEVLLIYDIAENVSFTGDFQWTKEALENIVKNCMEHTPSGGQIQIEAQENPIYTEIIVRDNGTGIQKEDLPHLFERFYRGKGTENTGVGIGLSLAAEIVRRQNGTIKVFNAKNGGAEFQIRFYKMLP